MDIAQFRLDFPEFSDIVLYPDSMVNFWATLGEKINAIDRFGDVYNNLIELFVAHNLALQRRDIEESEGGAIPGFTIGAANNKHVGSMSIGYDLKIGDINDAGWWNLTIYGKQYFYLMKLFTHGAYQL